DQDIDPAEEFVCLLEEPFRCRLIGDVSLHRDAASSLALDLCANLFGLCLLTRGRKVDHHVCPFAGKCDRYTCADARTRTCDKSCATVQFAHIHPLLRDGSAWPMLTESCLPPCCIRAPLPSDFKNHVEVGQRAGRRPQAVRKVIILERLRRSCELADLGLRESHGNETFAH